MNILLTGVTGFIGSAVAARLVASGHKVHAVVRDSSDTSQISDAIHIHRHDGSTEQLCSLMQQTSPSVVVHLASLFLADHKLDQVAGLIDSNLKFGTQLLEAMRQANISRFVNTGTCWQHYESHAVRPVNLYAATKQAFDEILNYYHDEHKISQVTLKLCDTYGPNDKRRKLIGILLQAAHTQERLDMSPGEQVLDLTYIDDIVSAYERAIAIVQSSKVNISERYIVSGSRHTLKEVVEIVGEVTSCRIDANFGGRPYRNREVMVPSDKCELKLSGWTPEFDLRTGLAKMICQIKSL